MVAKLRSDCRIAAPVGASAAWPTSEEPARMATPRAAQNGTFQRVSRRSMEDVIGSSHDSTPYDGRREAPCTPRARHDAGARAWARDAHASARGRRGRRRRRRCAPTDFLLKVAVIKGAPPERMDVRVTRAWPTSGTYRQRLLDWCCMPTGRVLPSDRQAP